MAKKQLTGTLDEQCGFLYELAQEKMASGNYTGAVYVLKEIIKYQPNYADAEQMLENARQHKKEQLFRLFISLGGAILFIGIGSTAGLRNDLWLLALGIVGLLIGYGISNLIRRPVTSL